MRYKSTKFLAVAASVIAAAIGFTGVLAGIPFLMYAGGLGYVGVISFLILQGNRYLRVAHARNSRILQGQKSDLKSLDDNLQAMRREQSAFASASRIAEDTLGRLAIEKTELKLGLETVRASVQAAERLAAVRDDEHRRAKSELQLELERARASAREAEASATMKDAKVREVESALSRTIQDAQKTLQDLQRSHKAELVKVSSEAQVQGADKFKADVMARVAQFGASRPKVAAPFGFSPDAFYGAQHHKDIRILERIAMKMGSLRAREAIALSATSHRHGLSEVLLIARSSYSGMMDDGIYAVVRSWDIRSLLSLARVLADQSLLESDQSDAVAIYELAIAAFGVKGLDERAQYIFLETLQSLGRVDHLFDRMEALNFKQRDAVQTALLNCNEIMRESTSPRPASPAWFHPLNELYVNAGLAPIRCGNEGPDLLDSLVTDAPPIEDGPLVSVMMATHNGSDRIGTAIRSILNQSWKNLELIIVDDFSDDDHWLALQQYPLLDPRVRVYRLDSNQGAYRARNFAFGQTRGEFVTVHDDDDWSHSQKIEIQVNHLIAEPGVIGNMSFQTRIDENFVFLRINDNPKFNQRNYSSMMVRRELVSRLGGWDDVNRAADAEFHDRVRAVTGQVIEGIETPPLSFMRARSGSLTSGEIRKGALDFARQTFGLLYSGWHQTLAQSQQEQGSIEAPATDPKRRSYAVPANMVPGRRNVAFKKFDVIFVTDFRFPGGNSSLIAAEIEAASAAGLRVAVAQLDSPVLRANHGFNQVVHRVISSFDVPILTLNDDVETSLVVIRNPTVLQYADRLRSQIVTDKLVIIANSAPLGRNGSNFCYDLDACEVAAAGMFGVKPVVYPESPQTRDLNVALFPAVNYAASEWAGFLEPANFEFERDIAVNRRPVVGRHSRDHALKWPDTVADIRQAYVQPETFDTRILGGAESIQGMLDFSNEPSVTVLPFGSEEPREFLKSIDFWVYQHSSNLTESFGMAALEGLASGAVVILPPYMERLFGNAALYAAPDAVSGLVRKYWDDPALYKLQSARAVDTVRARFSGVSFVDRLSLLTEGSALSPEMASPVIAGKYV